MDPVIMIIVVAFFAVSAILATLSVFAPIKWEKHMSKFTIVFIPCLALLSILFIIWHALPLFL